MSGGKDLAPPPPPAAGGNLPVKSEEEAAAVAAVEPTAAAQAAGGAATAAVGESVSFHPFQPQRWAQTANSEYKVRAIQQLLTYGIELRNGRTLYIREDNVF